jgi:transposase
MLRGMSRAAVTPKGRVLRHPGDLQWLERRRLQAADLFAQGKTRAEVAGELGVSAQTASRWFTRWRDGGVAGMRTARQGKPARLGPAQLAKVRRLDPNGYPDPIKMGGRPKRSTAWTGGRRALWCPPQPECERREGCRPRGRGDHRNHEDQERDPACQHRS